MKILFVFMTFILLISCNKNVSIQKESIDNLPLEKNENILVLPAKDKPQSMLMSDSPIKPNNIDSYLFFSDCLYIDVRSPESFYKEGHIAGFINFPFYDYVAGFPNSYEPLFQMKKKDGTFLGDVGSFVPNYEESEQVILDTFDKNKKIIVISTAGVESCYFLNLLVQLGYNCEYLYNAGSFTNGMGNDIAYRSYPGAKYLVPSFELYDTKVFYKYENLTRLAK